MNDYYCSSDAPEELKREIRDIENFKRYVKSITPQARSEALGFIHMRHDDRRSVVKDEIEARLHQDSQTRSEKSLTQADSHHADSHRWNRFSVGVGTLGFFLALAGRFWPTNQVTQLETHVQTIESHDQTAEARLHQLDQRVALIEKQLSSAPVSPPPTTLRPSATPLPKQSPSTSPSAANHATQSATPPPNPATPSPEAKP